MTLNVGNQKIMVPQMLSLRDLIIAPPHREEIIMVLGQFMTAGVVPCGDPKKSPRTSSIVQIILSFRSFEISEDILRNQKFIIGLDSFLSNV